MTLNDFQSRTSAFLRDRPHKTVGASEKTQKSYKEAFRLLFVFMKEIHGIRPTEIEFEHLDADTLCGFLDWLESERGCSPSTRNARLAALRSFANYLEFRAPEHLDFVMAARSINRKKVVDGEVRYLRPEAAKAMVEAAEATDLRHLAIIQLMYDSAARVSEIAGLTMGKTCLQAHDSEEISCVHIMGKGRKAHTVPISRQTAATLRAYIRKYRRRASASDPLFCGRSGKDPITIAGIGYVVKKYAAIVRQKDRSLMPITVSNHTLRHSRATHWLTEGVSMDVISRLLGHSSTVITQQVYAKVTAELEAKALSKVEDRVLGDFEYSEQKEDELESWFASVFL